MEETKDTEDKLKYTSEEVMNRTEQNNGEEKSKNEQKEYQNNEGRKKDEKVEMEKKKSGQETKEREKIESEEQTMEKKKRQENEEEDGTGKAQERADRDKEEKKTDETNREEWNRQVKEQKEKIKEEKKKKENEKAEEKKKKEQEKIENVLEMLNEINSGNRPLEDALPVIKEYMDINDSDMLRCSEKTAMKDLLKKMHDDLSINQGLLKTSTLEPSEVIKGSSVLEGIYFSQDPTDWEKSRSPLVDLIGDVCFKTPCQSEKEYYEEFYTMKDKNKFDMVVEKRGYNFAVKVCFRTITKTGISAELQSESNKETIKDTKTLTSNATLNKTLYTVVPVVLWEPTRQNIILAKEPKSDLCTISSLLSNGATEQAKCLALTFFDKYGSHYYLGKSHFGGTLKIETTYEGNASESLNCMKSVVQSHHSAAITACNLFSTVSFGGESSGHKHDTEGKAQNVVERAEEKKITNTMTKIGGPLEVNSVPLWKKGLIQSNSTWVVVSSGEPVIERDKLQIRDYIGIWELVLSEASNFGSNALKLSKFLIETWRNKTGFVADSSFIDSFEIQQTEQLLREFIKNIQDQMKQNLLFKILIQLYEKIVEIKKIPGCHKLWENELCNNKIILDLFKTITATGLDEGTELRWQMKKLLDITEAETFPYQREILLWLQPTPESRLSQTLIGEKITSVEKFLTYIGESYLREKRLTLGKVEENREQKRNILQKMTGEIASLIVELLKHLKEKNDHIMYIFLLSVILEIDFDITEYAFRSLLTIDQLSNFLSSSQSHLQRHHQFGKKGSSAEEAFLWHHLLETIIQKTNEKECEAQRLYEEVNRHIRDNNIDVKFHSQIKLTLQKKIFDGLTSFGNLMCGKDINQRPVIMWNYFENIPTFKQSELIDKAKEDLCLETGHDVLHILEMLGFTKYFPGKLKIKDVLTLEQINSICNKDAVQIPWIMLRKIMSIDFTYREQVLDDFIKTMPCDTKEDDANEDDDDDLFSTTASVSTEDHVQSQWDKLHPTDVFLAIFKCCDPFLKQVIVQKISVCQLAVPFLYTDFTRNQIILSLFPLRDVFTDGRSECVATASLKTVSFIRIGNGLTKSKSKIINEVLRKNNEEHSTFFHRDCPRGMSDRTISKGLVEASWYVPRHGQEVLDDQVLQDKDIPEPITVLNLRGDAADFVEQINKILMVSNIITIFIKYEDLRNDKNKSILRKIHESKCLVLLLTDATSNDITRDDFVLSYKNKIGNKNTKLISTFDMKQRRETNANELKNLLKKNIIKQLNNINRGVILDKLSIEKGMLTDETSICKTMQLKAKSLYQQVQESSSSYRKQHFTPLQCEDLWQKWSAKQKDQKRQTNQTHYDTEEKLVREMQSLRMKQVETCNTMPDTVAQFVHNLLDNIDDNESINYFLFFFRQYLDNDSKIIIPKLQEDFRRAFEKYQSMKERGIDSKRQIDEIENELVRASFGLEHFFREIGQIYEAFVYCQDELRYTMSYKTERIIQTLPRTVAKLLLLGQPLELMDGDAANVPLKWIIAVFDQLKQILNNGKLLSISVLGIQSSGKSTLLNTMFGLRFAVSAGRCTRGLYAQIIPVSQPNTSFKFDYAIIIDTEGLRAPELASGKINHDNELATLVIGLADTVLINIKGETIADMENVLQIVVHGLLRLKQANKNLNLQHRCIFVHQNVSAEDARNQMLQGNKNTIERLDEMTKEVAIQEGISEVSCFKDVIDLDPTKDMKFLPDLWNGTRPMAPASTTYSIKAVEIRTNILEYASTGRHVCMNIENKMIHLRSLWNGILNENFVFSFRNNLEVKAYSLMESEFQSLLSVLDYEKLQWMTENIKPRLIKKESIEQLDAEGTSLRNDFKTNITKKEVDMGEKLVTFINQSELSEIMIIWKTQKLTNLTYTTETMVQDIEKQIRHEIQQRQFSLTTDDLLANKKQQVYHKAKEVALSFKDRQLTPSDILDQFQKLWVTWINELIPETAEDKMEVKDRNLEENIKKVLYEKFGDQKHLLTAELKNQSLKTPPDLVCGKLKYSITKISDDSVTAKTFLKRAKKWWRGTPEQPILDTINSSFSDIDDIFESLFEQETEFEISQLRQIIDKIRTGFKSFDNKNELGYSLTPKFEVFIAFHVARHSYQKFKTLNREYEQNHGLRDRLMKYKPEAQQLFIDICQAKSEEIIATNILCTTLQKLVKERVERNMPPKIQNEIINTHFKQKRILMKSVLEELAKKNDFELYRVYITAPDRYVRDWLTKKINDELFNTKHEEKSKYDIWLESYIVYFIENLMDAVRFATEKCSNKKKSNSSLSDWIKILTGQVEPLKFLIAKDTFQHVTEYTISSFSEFSANVVKELETKVKSNLKVELRSRSPNEMKWSGENPYTNIFDALWGCSETCPFCSEPCQKSMKNHGSDIDCHTCIQHRPAGISGIYWSNSMKLAIESCNFKVQSTTTLTCGEWCGCPDTNKCQMSHPYKKYKSFQPQWEIAPLPDSASAPYWMWFMANHKNNLAEYYKTELPDIPSSWNIITQEKAIESLSDIYINV